MKSSALGLVETYGYLGAIEASDAALKCANVNMVGCEFVKGGIVTIKITGDVSAVKAAIDAAEISVTKIGIPITTHVIARPYNEVWKMLETNFTIEQVNSCQKINYEDESIFIEENIEIEDQSKVKGKNIEVDDNLSFKTRDELKSMKVDKLRSLARKLKIRTMTKKQIKYAKKNQLIDAILAKWEGSES